MSLKCAVYVGHVVHHRLRPRTHKLRHAVFWLLLDLDELDRLGATLRLFSHNRANVFSFRDRDHGDGTETPLREQIIGRLAAAGLDTEGASIAILCMPRVLGYDFNPISVYYCTRRDGSAIATVYQVNNTFHQRHLYVIPVADHGDRAIRQASPKEFFVSPFLDMDMSYAFRTALPAEEVHLSVEGLDRDGPIIRTALSGRHRPLTDVTLMRLLLTYPFLTRKVVGWIHWHALRMWIKGFKLTHQPPTPPLGTTVVPTPKQEREA